MADSNKKQIIAAFIDILKRNSYNSITLEKIARKAKVKNTGSILPGHGGLLDRIDGVIFVLPAAYLINKIFF